MQKCRLGVMVDLQPWNDREMKMSFLSQKHSCIHEVPDPWIFPPIITFVACFHTFLQFF